MKKIATIYLDMDGVIADFHQAALKAHGVEPSCRHMWPVFGQDLPTRLGLDQSDDSWKPIFWKPLLAVENFWLNIEKFSWTEDLLKLCDSYARWLVILTSPAKSFEDVDKEAKLKWLCKHSIHREVRFESKKATYSTPGTVLIDDWEKQVDPFNEGQGKAILFPQPWNSNHHNCAHPLDYVHAQLDNFTR